jgi:hypothetical protein
MHCFMIIVEDQCAGLIAQHHSEHIQLFNACMNIYATFETEVGKIANMQARAGIRCALHVWLVVMVEDTRTVCLQYVTVGCPQICK